MSLESLFGMSTETEKQPLVGVQLVDYSQLVLATIMVTYKPQDVITEAGIRVLILNTIKSNVAKNKKKYPTTVICVDNASQGYWRRDVAYYYKKNRKDSREKSDWDWSIIFGAMSSVKEELKENFPYHVIDKVKTEADDIIAVLTKHIHTTYPWVDVLINSSDGDFVQLHKYQNVKQWSPIQKKWVLAKSGSPRNDLISKIVLGDRKDGVSSIRECSDWNFTKPEGKRAKPVSREKYLNPLFDMVNPVDAPYMTEEERIRYKENEVLIDFDFIPEYISSPIISTFENEPVAPRSKIYPYLAKKGLVTLLDSASFF